MLVDLDHGRPCSSMVSRRGSGQKRVIVDVVQREAVRRRKSSTTRILSCAMVLASTLGCRGEAPPAPTRPAVTVEPEPASPGSSIDPSSGFVRVDLAPLDADHHSMLAAVGELGTVTILVRGPELAPVRDALAATSGYADMADMIAPLRLGLDGGLDGVLTALAASARLETEATLELSKIDASRPAILSLFEPAITSAADTSRLMSFVPMNSTT